MITVNTYRGIENPTARTKAELTEIWQKAWDDVRDHEIPSLRAKIETEFRKLLDPAA
jgi:hypothetical protein